MSERMDCPKCGATGYEVRGEYRFLCGSCMGLKNIITKLDPDEILFACRSFEQWINIKYDNHRNKKDRQFLSAWAQLSPDIDHSELLRRILSGGEVRPQP